LRDVRDEDVMKNQIKTVLLLGVLSALLTGVSGAVTRTCPADALERPDRKATATPADVRPRRSCSS